MRWRSSSYSTGQGGECVEVATEWHKSSRSSGAGGECVEVAHCPSVLHVRDSKYTNGPVLDHSPAAWREFLGFAAR